MSKVVDITGASSKEARLKRIIASLEEIKDTLVDVIDAYEAEDESSDKLDPRIAGVADAALTNPCFIGFLALQNQS